MLGEDHVDNADNITLKQVSDIIQKHWKFLLIIIVLTWSSVGVAYFFFPKEYEASYIVKLDGTVQPATLNVLLQADSLKQEAIRKVKSNAKMDVSWDTKRISVNNIRNTNVLQVLVRGKSVEEAEQIANAFFNEQRATIDALNKAEMSQTEAAISYVEAAKKRVQMTNERERELALIEYKAVQNSFQTQYMQRQYSSLKITQIGPTVIDDHVAFPKARIFVEIAAASSTVCICIVVLGFWWREGIRV